jgi:hypothetical protein
MYILIENNEIIGSSINPPVLEIGQSHVEYNGPEGGLKLVDGKAVLKTEVELATEKMELLVSDGWVNLRNSRTLLLRDTDDLLISDRPVTPRVLDYRTMLRDLPSTYNDTTILEQSEIPNFEDWKSLG